MITKKQIIQLAKDLAQNDEIAKAYQLLDQMIPQHFLYDPDILKIKFELWQMIRHLQDPRFYQDYYSSSILPNQELRARHKLALSWIKKLNSDSVLEVGIGRGELALELLKLNFDLHAVDIDQRTLDELQANACNLKAKLDIGRQLPDKEFDLVISLEVIEHVQNPWKFLSSLLERLKPNGYCLLSSPDVPHDNNSNWHHIFTDIHQHVHCLPSALIARRSFELRLANTVEIHRSTNPNEPGMVLLKKPASRDRILLLAETKKQALDLIKEYEQSLILVSGPWVKDVSASHQMPLSVPLNEIDWTKQYDKVVNQMKLDIPI